MQLDKNDVLSAPCAFNLCIRLPTILHQTETDITIPGRKILIHYLYQLLRFMTDMENY
jgi:hypothetical protein